MRKIRLTYNVFKGGKKLVGEKEVKERQYIIYRRFYNCMGIRNVAYTRKGERVYYVAYVG